MQKNKAVNYSFNLPSNIHYILYEFVLVLHLHWIKYSKKVFFFFLKCPDFEETDSDFDRQLVLYTRLHKRLLFLNLYEADWRQDTTHSISDTAVHTIMGDGGATGG